ncbi:MAG: translation initiation factor IF-2 [Alphaproteobacteria bacterium]|nr:translation initiation factor IF-2 [Alphaproteobacteria bacterium]
MTDTPKQKTTLTLGKKLDLKKPADSEQVRQSFAHGRSKTVAVEVKKKRSAPGDKVADSQGHSSGMSQDDRAVFSHFTKDELESRMRAVKEAMKEPHKKAYEEKAAPSDSASTQETESNATDVAEKAEQEAPTSPHAVAPASSPAAPTSSQSEAPSSASPTIFRNEPTPSDRRPAAAQSYDKQRSERTPYTQQKRTETPAARPASSEPVIFKSNEYKSPKPLVGPFEDLDENGLAKKRAPSSHGHGHHSNKVAEPKKIAPVAPARKDTDPVAALPRKLTGTALTRALNDDIAVRTRSMAAFKRAKQKNKQTMNQAEAVMVVREVIILDTMSVGELANRMAVRGADVVKSLMKMGMMVTINQIIDADTAELVCTEFGHTPKRVSDSDIEIGLKGADDAGTDLMSRAPVVTIMGHVDHGKTSLLDALRETDVVSGEAGGITQHIGAYQVQIKSGQRITFIDTPGHAAFTEMRARGANLTDVVVLVVAADDGIMPQTIEAINHAKAANVPMVVAINKVDKPDSNPDRVRSELLQHGVVLEEFGGDVLAIEVSAKKRMNLDKLEEAILLQAEVLDLKANPNRTAEGVVIESKLERGRGTVATVLVQRGSLKIGDIFVAGKEWGRVRALVNDHGQKVNEALPSLPIEVIGFNGLPAAGDEFYVVETEARAREVSEYREHKEKEAKAAAISKSNMDKIMNRLATVEAKELAVVIKTDVQGSLEAITGSLMKLANDEVTVRILHGAVGGINESDVTLARASGGMIIGFNVRANPQARDIARRDAVNIRYYSIIYNVIDDIKASLGGLLSPTLKENFLGYAQIREIFNITKVGKIAGCYVTEGMVKRGAKVRLLRDDVVIHEGTLKTLRRFKDEVKEAKEGFECGMAFENYDDIKQGDVIECFEIESIARVL